MEKVINLNEKRPHMQGETVCLGCGHKSRAVAPIGTVFMECSNCGTMKEVFKYPVEREGLHWKCNCGNELFKMTPDGIYCPNCGAWQKGF